MTRQSLVKNFTIVYILSVKAVGAASKICAILCFYLIFLYRTYANSINADLKNFVFIFFKYVFMLYL